jgi:proline iminopeptidase
VSPSPAPRQCAHRDSAEHKALWPRMAEIWPDHDNYQKKTDRQIPLIILECI